MSFTSFTLLLNFLLVVFGDRNKDYEKNWMKELNVSIFPTEVLYLSGELEYFRYIKRGQNVESKDSMLHQPDIMPENWIETPALINTYPDEQNFHFSMRRWEKNKNGNIQENKKGVVSPIAESMIQLLEHTGTAKDGLLNYGGLKKDSELSGKLVQQSSMDGNKSIQNMTEVYERPFVRVYMNPLCSGPNC